MQNNVNLPHPSGQFLPAYGDYLADLHPAPNHAINNPVPINPPTIPLNRYRNQLFQAHFKHLQTAMLVYYEKDFPEALTMCIDKFVLLQNVGANVSDQLRKSLSH